jgi:SAM-dependent methyltransferase
MGRSAVKIVCRAPSICAPIWQAQLMSSYVHGYSERESRRLQDQAATLTELLHGDTRFDAGAKVLEAGCGVGAQTVILVDNSPDAILTSIDLSAESLATAQETLTTLGRTDVEFRVADIFDLPFADESFDHVFVCFVLEHLADPVGALRALRRVLKSGGSITVIEGDHGSTFFHPDSDLARRAVRSQVELQARSGGNADIGRSLYPLLDAAGFGDVQVSPRMVYVDGSRPHLIEGFTRNTFTAMIEGIREEVVAAELMTPDEFEAGVRDLLSTATPDGVFSYTFFKAVGIR